MLVCYSSGFHPCEVPLSSQSWIVPPQGLLTAKVQSREPVAGVSTTLDGLRAGDVGAPVARPDVAALHTNAFLPQ